MSLRQRSTELAFQIKFQDVVAMHRVLSRPLSVTPPFRSVFSCTSVKFPAAITCRVIAKFILATYMNELCCQVQFHESALFVSLVISFIALKSTTLLLLMAVRWSYPSVLIRCLTGVVSMSDLRNTFLGAQKFNNEEHVVLSRINVFNRDCHCRIEDEETHINDNGAQTYLTIDFPIVGCKPERYNQQLYYFLHTATKQVKTNQFKSNDWVESWVSLHVINVTSSQSFEMSSVHVLRETEKVMLPIYK
mgnify:CR=1 FL=1